MNSAAAAGRRLFVGGVLCETNTFSAFRTCGEDFFDDTWISGHIDAQAPVLALRGWTLVRGPVRQAEPAGVTLRAAYEAEATRLLESLRAAMPVQAVTLVLHGAMVAEGIDDCEGDLAARVRALVGPQVPIVLPLDPHAHLTQQMLANGDIVLFYKEWPHTDAFATLARGMELAVAVAEGAIRPATAVWDCRMIEPCDTGRGAMKAIVERLRALEQVPGIVAASVCHGFAGADVQELGAKVVVVSDGDMARSRAEAERLGEALFAARGRLAPPWQPLPSGLDAVAACGLQPVVVADVGDMPGGGAAGDGVRVLQGLLARGVQRIAAAYVWDPMSLDLAWRAGMGARLAMRIGGKLSPASGPPLDLPEVRVEALFDPLEVHLPDGRLTVGRVALLQAPGLLVAVSQRRIAALHPAHFQAMGIDIAQQRVLVVKSAHNYRAGFDGVVRAHFPVTYPGVTDLPIEAGRYPRARRPLWPLDEPAAADRGLFPAEAATPACAGTPPHPAPRDDDHAANHPSGP